MSIDFKINGVDGVMKALDQLEKKARSQLTNKALRAGGKVVLEEAKKRVPKGDTQTLAKSLTIAAKKSRDQMIKEILIVPRKGKNERYDAFYAHFVEFGTSHSRAQPFLGPAAKEKAQDAITEIAKFLRDELID